LHDFVQGRRHDVEHEVRQALGQWRVFVVDLGRLKLFDPRERLGL
jgi:hypothetical protein